MISEKRNKIERYLFTAVFNNAIFDRNNTGGTLTITKDDTESIIQFSDRPFRQTENINFDTFVSLFSSSGNNSFEEDPPNGVLTHDEEQRTYIIRLLNSDTNSAIFSLELLQGETHNLNTLLGRMNLFVDAGAGAGTGAGDNDNADGPYTPSTRRELIKAIEQYISDDHDTTKGNIKNWDVSNVKDMSNLFKNMSDFNEDISAWNVSNVTDMSYMFAGCEIFNSDLSAWNVSNVTTMDSMFYGCTTFNKDISDWDDKLSNVTNMSYMFYDCTEFNQDISRWDVSSVTEHSGFYNNSGLSDEQVPPKFRTS